MNKKFLLFSILNFNKAQCLNSAGCILFYFILFSVWNVQNQNDADLFFAVEAITKITIDI